MQYMLCALDKHEIKRWQIYALAKILAATIVTLLYMMQSHSMIAAGDDDKDNLSFPQHTACVYLYPKLGQEFKSISVDFQFLEDPDKYKGRFVFAPIQAWLGDDLFYFMLNFNVYYARAKIEDEWSRRHVGSAYKFRKFGVENTDVLRPSKLALVDTAPIEGKTSTILVPGPLKAGLYTLTLSVDEMDRVLGKAGYWIKVEVYRHMDKTNVDLGAIFCCGKRPTIEKNPGAFFEAVEDPRLDKSNALWPTKPIVVGNIKVDDKPLEFNSIGATYPIETVCETDCRIVTNATRKIYPAIAETFVNNDSIMFEFPQQILDRKDYHIGSDKSSMRKRFYIETLKADGVYADK